MQHQPSLSAASPFFHVSFEHDQDCMLSISDVIESCHYRLSVACDAQASYTSTNW